MIRFADSNEPNKKGFDIDKVKNLLKSIFEESYYGAGSFHQEVNLTNLIDIADKILFKQNNTSLHLIIDRNPNNSIDITIDKIE